jgi:hypothetical protein
MKPKVEAGLTRIDMEKMHHVVQHNLRRVYQRIKRPWCQKDCGWTGKLVIPSRTAWTGTLVYEIEFLVV